VEVHLRDAAVTREPSEAGQSAARVTPAVAPPSPEHAATTLAPVREATEAVAARTAGTHPTATMPPRVAQVAAQAAYWLRTSLRANRGEAVVTLDPPELGRMRITVRQEGEALTARILAELPEVEGILREGVAAIRDRLEQQGFRLESLAIESTARHEAPVAPQPDAADGSQTHTGSQGHQTAGRRADTPAAPAGEERPAPTTEHDDYDRPPENGGDRASRGAGIRARGIDVRA
jgi:hypothetical protein